MEKLARALANKISESLAYDAEKEAVIAYGLIALIQMGLTTLLVLLLGIMIGAPLEAMILCFSVSILRKYSGGAHAHTAEFCTVFSVLYCVVMAALSKMVLVNVYQPLLMAASAILVFCISFLIVYRRAPVDSPQKPIRTEEKKKKMRKGSFFVLSVYVIISILFFTLGYRYENFRSFGISLLLGVSWQIFTLTGMGAIVIERMNRIFVLRKEGKI